MATTRDELESFQLYATARLSGAGAELSLDELFQEWIDVRDRPLLNDAIRRGLADIDARRHEPADVAMKKVRGEFGLARE